MSARVAGRVRRIRRTGSQQKQGGSDHGVPTTTGGFRYIGPAKCGGLAVGSGSLRPLRRPNPPEHARLNRSVSPGAECCSRRRPGPLPIRRVQMLSCGDRERCFSRADKSQRKSQSGSKVRRNRSTWAYAVEDGFPSTSAINPQVRCSFGRRKTLVGHRMVTAGSSTGNLARPGMGPAKGPIDSVACD